MQGREENWISLDHVHTVHTCGYRWIMVFFCGNSSVKCSCDSNDHQDLQLGIACVEWHFQVCINEALYVPVSIFLEILKLF